MEWPTPNEFVDFLNRLETALSITPADSKKAASLLRSITAENEDLRRMLHAIYPDPDMKAIEDRHIYFKLDPFDNE